MMDQHVWDILKVTQDNGIQDAIAESLMKSMQLRQQNRTPKVALALHPKRPPILTPLHYSTLSIPKIVPYIIVTS